MTNEQAKEAAIIQARLEELNEEWKRRQRELIDNAKVVVSTVRTGVNRALAAKFDHVLIDEASMVSLADGTILALQQSIERPRGSLLLFGDMMQLGPIVPRGGQDAEDSPEDDQRHRGSPAAVDHRVMDFWFGESVLRYVQTLEQPAAPCIMLDEQSRMNPVLCQVVSEASYGGRLRATKNASRVGTETIPVGIAIADPDDPPRHCQAQVLAAKDSLARAKVNGVYQRESAMLTVALARRLDAQERCSILVCTPYRAQANLLRRGLADCQHIRVGTIHRMQGQEADVCFFDPAQAAHWFISTSLTAQRLVNVAASRAKHALVICNSREYLAINPQFRLYLAAGKRLL